MDRAKTQKKKCSQVPGKTESKKNLRNRSLRNPLREVNNVKISNCSNSSGGGGGGSSSVSSSVSVEAPRGCLRFFLSQSSSTKTPFNDSRPEKAKALSKTPKSAPISRPNKPLLKSKPLIKQNQSKLPKRVVSEAPISQKLRKVETLQPQFPRKPSSKIGGNSKDVVFMNSSCSNVNKLASESQITPLNKLGTGSVLDCGGDVDTDEVMEDEKFKNSGRSSRTPPIQASLSPEIQCGSNAVSIKEKTPACYAAGHVISGVTDKRKCRPRGILAVGDISDASSFGKPKALKIFDVEDSGVENGEISRLSLVPSLAEASMHWLLSPCREEDENDKENSDVRSCQLRGLVGHKTVDSPSSPLSELAFSLDLCNIGTADGRRRSSGRKYMLSPGEIPRFKGYLDSLCENVVVSSPNAMPCDGTEFLEGERKLRYDFDGSGYPFSMDSLGAENVIQTPESESSSEKRVGFSYLSVNDKLTTAAEDVRRANLSLKSHVSIWDQTNSSFQFDHLPSPSSSVDLSQFQKALDDQALWKSDSTMEDLSNSQMRISWREGLASRMFEIDELDGCRCFSDEEEEDFKINNSKPLKSRQIPSTHNNAGNGSISTDALGSTEFQDNKVLAEENYTEKLHPMSRNSCAESFSTDGGGLVSSEDSNWSLCYKNSLFKS